MQLICIPGNHDKTDYSRKNSFLDPFKYHPSLTLIEEYNEFDLVENVRFHFIPYFEAVSNPNLG